MTTDEYRADLFVKMREAWFNEKLRYCAHEREWEDEEACKTRKEDNEEMKEVYDSQTRQILSGKKLCLTPTCYHDMVK